MQNVNSIMNGHNPSRHLSTNDIHKLMTQPSIESFFVNSYEDAVRYNTGFTSSVHLFINLKDRQIYMKYLDMSTGNDIIHIFSLMNQTPTINQVQDNYKAMNCQNNMLSTSNDKVDNNYQEIMHKISDIYDKLKSLTQLESKINSVIEELGVNDAKSTEQS